MKVCSLPDDFHGAINLSNKNHTCEHHKRNALYFHKFEIQVRFQIFLACTVRVIRTGPVWNRLNRAVILTHLALRDKTTTITIWPPHSLCEQAYSQVLSVRRIHTHFSQD